MFFRMEGGSSPGEVTFELRPRRREERLGVCAEHHARPRGCGLGKAERWGTPVHPPVLTR